jgi:4-hydroxy-4-methyl-2-oxoglutarate aldolase
MPRCRRTGGDELPLIRRAINPEGTVKVNLGSVTVPVVCTNALVNSGEVVVADHRRAGRRPPHVRAKSPRRPADARSMGRGQRERFAVGEVGLDVYPICPALEAAGLKYVD